MRPRLIFLRGKFMSLSMSRPGASSDGARPISVSRCTSSARVRHGDPPARAEHGRQVGGGDRPHAASAGLRKPSGRRRGTAPLPCVPRHCAKNTRKTRPSFSPAPSRAPVLPNANTDLTRDSARPFAQAARGVARRPWRSVPAPRWAPLTPVRRSRTLDDGFLSGVKTRQTSPVPRRASVPRAPRPPSRRDPSLTARASRPRPPSTDADCARQFESLGLPKLPPRVD